MPKPKSPNNELASIDLKQLERELYLSSFYDFFVAAFNVLKPDEYDDNWHIKYICDLLQTEVERIQKKRKRKKHLIINVPPRSSKSKIVTVIFPVWAMLKLGSVDIVTATHSNSKAEEDSDESRTLIKSDWFQERFGLDLIIKKESDAKSRWKTTKGGKRTAFGITSNFLGENADIIICDDLMDTDTVNSKAERETALDKFKKSLSSRLNNKAVSLIINIQQRLHSEDITGWILENLPDHYQLVKIPSEARSENEVSPPELFRFYRNGLFWDKEGRFSREDLEVEKKTLGSRGYANMHLQKPFAVDEGVFKTDWFNVISEHQFETIFHQAQAEPVFNFFLDTAYTKDKGNDASAVVVACQHKGKVYIREVQQVRKEFPELVKWLKAYLPKYHSGQSRVYIEAKASGLSLIQQLRDEGGFNVLRLDTGKDSKLTRAIQQTAFVEAGNVFLVKGNWNDEFLDQLTTFKDGKSGHDDQVDSFVYAIRQLKQQGSGFFYATT